MAKRRRGEVLDTRIVGEVARTSQAPLPWWWTPAPLNQRLLPTNATPAAADADTGPPSSPGETGQGGAIAGVGDVVGFNADAVATGVGAMGGLAGLAGVPAAGLVSNAVSGLVGIPAVNDALSAAFPVGFVGENNSFTPAVPTGSFRVGTFNVPTGYVPSEHGNQMGRPTQQAFQAQRQGERAPTLSPRPNAPEAEEPEADGVAAGLAAAAAAPTGPGSSSTGVPGAADNAPTADAPNVGVVGADGGISAAPGPGGDASAGNASAGQGDAPADAGGGVSGVFQRGGSVPDVSKAPGGAEPITAHQGEFVVKAASARKYRPLLDAINRNDTKKIKTLAQRIAG